jgi:hypothetical protein
MMSKEAVLTVLERAAEDTNFFGQLAQDYTVTLKEYDLTTQEALAIGTADVCWIESHIGTPIEQQLMERVFIPLLSRERW